jgi:SAM-dependent methyltransferase
MMYQHPLAYLLGLEGHALLRSWAGDYDRAFVEERLAEIQALLANDALAGHPGVDVVRGTTRDGYETWAPSYDEPNGLFDMDEPLVYAIVDALPAGDALDAACGTGRFATRMAARGHHVIGVDSSPHMLDVARAKLPDADFRLGELQTLPVDDAAVDLVMCGLALIHVRDLAPVMAGFARVLRPGGHVIISDVHHHLVRLGSVAPAIGPNGEPGLTPTFRHSAGDFVRASLAAGLEVRGCEELRTVPTAPPKPARPDAEPGGWADWPWTLMAMVPAAARATAGGEVIVCDFQKPTAGRTA